jgi:glutaminyl-tRNA synthetase
MGVLEPLKVVIDNYPEDRTEEISAQNHPQKPEMGTRILPFGRELYIERNDFMENPPRKFFRLGPGREVRLRYGYYLTCVSYEKDADGNVTLLHCTYDPETKGGTSADGRKVKGTIHWVSAKDAVDGDVYLYDRLFNVEHPDGDKDVDFKTHLNPDSRKILEGCKLEPSLAAVEAGMQVQFERQGYFCLDPQLSTPDKPVFNRVVTLRDSWAKIKK